MKQLIRIVAFAAAINAAAAESTRYDQWFHGPVQHLMTAAEKEQWKSVKTEDEAGAFITLFWAKRDPTPQTPRNEFREEFDARVLVADRDFSNREMKGSMTDRGKVLILLGPPSQIGGRGAEARSRSNPNISRGDDWDGTVPSARAQGARQVWTYSGNRVPKYANRKEFDIVFIEEDRNDWQMATTERVNPQWLLQQAAQSYIVSPNLTSTPNLAAATGASLSTAFRDSALLNAYQTFKAENKTAIGNAPVTWGEFISPKGEPFVAVQLYVPASGGIRAGEELTFFGVFENEAGQIVEVHEGVTRLTATGADAYVDHSFRLAPGSYNATFGLAKAGSAVAMSTTKIKVAGLNPTEPGISDLFVSDNIQPLQTAWAPTDPFTFGGLKVVPKGDAVFPANGNLWYFLEMRNPGLNEQGAPKVQVRVDITGKTAKGPVRVDLPMSDAEIAKLKGAENRYAVGMAIPLEGFPPGDYLMKIRVVDTVLRKSYDFERPFRVQ